MLQSATRTRQDNKLPKNAPIITFKISFLKKYPPSSFLSKNNSNPFMKKFIKKYTSMYIM